MASSVTNKKLVMKYSTGSFSFDKIDVIAEPEQIYQLALAFNKFQIEQPPTKISYVETKQII